jgi:hypothetical protein
MLTLGSLLVLGGVRIQSVGSEAQNGRDARPGTLHEPFQRLAFPYGTRDFVSER